VRQKWTENDRSNYKENKKKEKDAFRKWLLKSRDHPNEEKKMPSIQNLSKNPRKFDAEPHIVHNA